MSRENLVNPMLRLPEAELSPLGDGPPLRVWSGVTPVGCVLLHDVGCEPCAGYLRRLRATAVLSGKEVRAVVCGLGQGLTHLLVAEQPAEALVLAFADPQRTMTAALRLPPPAWLVADRWGAVLVQRSAGDTHDWPDPGEIADWITFAATQCPECQGEAY